MNSSIRLIAAGAVALLLVPPSLGADEKDKSSSTPEKQGESKMIKTPSGLQYEDIVQGSGPRPRKGQTCVMHYTGWLWQNDAKGKQFDSSFDRGQPFEFPLGQGRVIKGWDEGVASMKVGGKRKLLIPPQLAYGAKGAGGGLIPPNATLYFEVSLLAIK
jgi:peptidylprolyl isomerase